MEVILIVLTSTLMGAFFVGFFLLGVYVGKKKVNNSKIPELTEQNKEYVKGIATFFDYRGE